MRRRLKGILSTEAALILIFVIVTAIIIGYAMTQNAIRQATSQKKLVDIISGSATYDASGYVTVKLYLVNFGNVPVSFSSSNVVLYYNGVEYSVSYPLDQTFIIRPGEEKCVSLIFGPVTDITTNSNKEVTIVVTYQDESSNVGTASIVLVAKPPEVQ